ncbi:MAG: carbohydrate ABC transporter permease [Lachnospiraceae bacterium]|nr:carbohydrate ABC transporter permease [Lachnospiraceae bacterium]
MNKRKPWQSVALYLFVFVLCIVILYPYFVMFITAAKTNDEMYAIDHILPQVWQWSNFTDIWSAAPVFKYFMNSMIVAGGGTAIAIICGIPAAYALARMKFKGKGFFMGAVIMSQMFSPVVLLVGIYKLMVSLSLNDSLLGLILLNAAFNQAFTIWLLRGTFISISPDMEQAAKIDGCGTVGSLIRVLLPMAAPGIITTLIFVFINAWNEYTIALTLISTDVLKPITVGINVFYGFNFIQWQYLFATSLFATIPVVVLFLMIEKHLVAGLTSGGVKG